MENVHHDLTKLHMVTGGFQGLPSSRQGRKVLMKKPRERRGRASREDKARENSGVREGKEKGSGRRAGKGEKGMPPS